MPITTSEEAYRKELVALVDHHARSVGVNPCEHLPGLHFYRAVEPTPPSPVVYKSSICVVAQGSKMLMAGTKNHVFDPMNYLVLSMPMPVEGRICEASKEKPYLSLALELDPTEVGELILEMEDDSRRDVAASRTVEETQAIYVSRMNKPFANAVLRLLRMLKDPREVNILGRSVVREIVYRLLSSEQGALLRASTLRDSNAQRVSLVIRMMQSRFDDPLDVPTLAGEVGMSVSALHHTFKAVTSLSPMQYLKRMRLHQARLLMLDGLNASEAAFRVGYSSPSQFSREFKRLFGETPTREVERFRAAQPTGEASTEYSTSL